MPTEATTPDVQEEDGPVPADDPRVAPPPPAAVATLTAAQQRAFPQRVQQAIAAARESTVRNVARTYHVIATQTNVEFASGSFTVFVVPPERLRTLINVFHVEGGMQMGRATWSDGCWSFTTKSAEGLEYGVTIAMTIRALLTGRPLPDDVRLVPGDIPRERIINPAF